MPRDTNGVYTLPSAVNPVVTGTLITANWGNTTLADVAQSLTNSLDRQGTGGMQAPLKLFDGAAAAPGVAFNNETNSGFYRAGAGDVRLVVLGTELMKFTSAGAQVSNALLLAGNAGAAGQVFTSAGAGAAPTWQSVPAAIANVGGTLYLAANYGGF